jgi:hypothetical protein
VDGIAELMRLTMQVVVMHSRIFSEETLDRQSNQLKTGSRQNKKTQWQKQMHKALGT